MEFNIRDIYLEDARIIIRPWENNNSDLIDLYQYAKIPGIGELAGWTHHQNIDESRKVLQMFIDKNEDLAIELKKNKQVIGSISLKHTNYIPKNVANKSLGREIGYVLSNNFWKQGYMTDACRMLINYAFQKLDLDFLIAKFTLSNHASRKVLEKCNFQLEKQITLNTHEGDLLPGLLFYLINSNKLLGPII